MVTPLTLVGGPRHGQVLDLKAPVKYISVPVISTDGCYVHAAVYDGLSGQWLRDHTPTPMPELPICPAWDDDAIAERGWFSRLRRVVGLRIAGLTGADLDHGDDW